MDYGPDWPPEPEVEYTPMTLAQKCGTWTITVLLIWAPGALALHAITPTGLQLDVPTPPAEGHTTEVTTTLRPSPHVAR